MSHDDPQDREDPRKLARRLTPTAAIVAATSSTGGLLSDPHFLHPSSILFDAASYLRKYVVPAVFAVYSAASWGPWGLWTASVVFGIALSTTTIRYLTLRYRIDGDEFVVTEGLIFRRIRSVPIRKIQNVDLVQNLLHRLLGVAEVNIETASGSKPEATLRVLTRDQIDELRDAIFLGAKKLRATMDSDAESTELPTDSQLATDAVPVASKALTEVQINYISTKQLLAAGLASNRGMVLLGIVVGLFFQGDQFWDNNANQWRELINRAKSYMPEDMSSQSTVLSLVLGAITLLVVLRLLSAAWYVLRFYDHRLVRVGDDLRVSCGLFTRVSATVPRRRIQFVSVHRPLIMRWIGLASIRIETAGGGGDENENAAASVSRRWFLPVVEYGKLAEILSQLRPGLQWQENEVHWHGVSPFAKKRLVRQAVIISILIACAGLLFTRPWGFLAGPLVLLLLIWIAIKKSKAMRYGRLPWGVVYRSGLLTKKMSFAFYDRIQALKLNQSPFDRRWKMASLRIDTAAAGPAEHVLDISYLDAEFAVSQFNDLQLTAAQHRPNWS